MMTSKEVMDQARNVDVAMLLPLLKQGQVNYFIEEGGRIRGVVSAELVRASLDRTWEVLTDFGCYKRHLPGIEHSHVVSRSGDSAHVKFAVGVRVMGVGGTVKYEYRFNIAKPNLDAFDCATGDISGIWNLHPVPGKKDETVLIHADVAKDLRAEHMVVRFLIDRLPPSEYAFHIAPIAMLTKGIRRWAEGLQ